MARSAIRSSTAVEVERRRDLAPDLGQRRHLVGAALRLRYSRAFWMRHADVGGERRQQAHVGLAEAAGLGVLWTLITPIASRRR